MPLPRPPPSSCRASSWLRWPALPAPLTQPRHRYERHRTFNSRLAAPSYEDKDYVATIAHEFFEKVAQKVLRSAEVEYIEVFPTMRPPSEQPAAGFPSWEEEWASGAHCDLQLTRSDWDATPRRDQLMMWLWLSDAKPDGGAMRILPGSHLKIVDHWYYFSISYRSPNSSSFVCAFLTAKC